jgi:hypothetical protein
VGPTASLKTVALRKVLTPNENQTKVVYVRLRVLRASMKMRAFWVIALCSFYVDRRFRGAYCLHQSKEKAKQSRYTPWRRLGGEEV